MWINKIFLTLTVAAGCLAAPRNIFNYNTDSLTGTQSGTPGRSVSGGYSWTAPNGQQVSINYIADGQGYRIVNSQNMFPAKQSLQQRSQPSHSVFVQTPKPTTQAPKAAVHSHFSVGTAFGSPSAPKYSWPQAAPKAAVPAPSKPTASNHWAMSHFQLGSQSRPTTTARATQRFTTARPTTTTTPARASPKPVTVIFFNPTPKPQASPSVAPAIKQKVFHPSQKISSTKTVSPNAISPSKVTSTSTGSETEANTKTAELKSSKALAAPEAEVEAKAAATEAPTEVSEPTAAETEGTEAEVGAEAGEAEGEEAAAEGEEGGEAEGGEEGGEGEEEAEGEEGEEAEGEEEEEAEGEEEDSNSEGEEW